MSAAIPLFPEPRSVVTQERLRGGWLPKSVASLREYRQARALDQRRAAKLQELLSELKAQEYCAQQCRDELQMPAFELLQRTRQGILWREQMHRNSAEEYRDKLRQLGVESGASPAPAQGVAR